MYKDAEGGGSARTCAMRGVRAYAAGMVPVWVHAAAVAGGLRSRRWW